MTNSKSTKRALLTSALAMLMCVAMLIGTTFAWFTDTASTAVNKIQAGTLDVALEMKNADGEWESAEGKTLEFKKAAGSEGEAVLWEPGCTYELPELRVVNNGNLALKYKVIITGIKGDAKLNEAIEWTIGEVALGTEQHLTAGANNEFTIKGHMKEDAGNEYQNLSIDGISITVVATQDTVESDSYDNQYDKNAVLPVYAIAKGNLNLTTNSTTSSATVLEEQTLSDSVMSVTYPADVLLKSDIIVDGTTDKKATVKQELKYVDDAPSAAMNSVTIGADKAVASYELTLPVAETNTTLVTVTINYTKGLSGVQIYHTGVLLPSSSESGEYATYDSTTGVITLHLFKASPIDIVYDKEPGVKTVKTQAELDTAIADTGIKTIKLGADWNGNILVNGANGITLDFNGYTVSDTMYIGATRDHILSGRADASTLTLMDSKGTGGVKTSGNKAIWMMNSSNLTIESGTYESTGISNHNRTIYVADSTLTVNGGYFHNNAASNNFHWVIQCDNKLGPATLVINGGKFEGPSSDKCAQNYLIKASEADPQYTTDKSGSVTINGGEFYSYTSNSYLAEGYSHVTVNNCTFVYESTNTTWTNKVFSLNDGYTLVVKGGRFTVNGKAYTNPDWGK